MLNYVIGDAVEADACEGNKIIAHIVNDYGGWGAGFVIPLARKYPAAKKAYRNWHKDKSGDSPSLSLGAVQIVPVDDLQRSLLDSRVPLGFVAVANMCAQKGNTRPGYVAVQYDALAECLDGVRVQAIEWNASVHMPRIGAGLGGGDWNTIEGYIEDHLDAIDVYVYDLPERT